MSEKKPLAAGNHMSFSVVIAEILGINEAIFLNQLHYWLQRSNNQRDGYTWVYRTVEQWELEFPFWSISTIKRIKKSLEESGIIIVSNFNKMKMDRTLWYRIDYEKIDKRLHEALVQNDTMDNVNLTQSLVQNEPMSLVQNEPMDNAKMNLPITIYYTDTTQDNKKTNNRHQYADDDYPMILANFLLNEIRKNNPSFKQPNLQTWADDMRKIIELDNRDKSEACNVIRWAQSSLFWQTNILSAKTLRKQYDKLKMQMDVEKKKAALTHEAESGQAPTERRSTTVDKTMDEED